MGTNVAQKANKTKKPLLGVWVPIGEEEKNKMKLFFGFRGMKASFLAEYPSYGRKALLQALDGDVKTTMLKDIRQFMEDHAEEVNEFMRSENEA
jgi:hypothetical protein